MNVELNLRQILNDAKSEFDLSETTCKLRWNENSYRNSDFTNYIA